MNKKRMSLTAWKRWRGTGIKVLIFLVAYLGILLSGWILSLYLSFFIWWESDPVYPLLHFLNTNKVWIGVAVLFIGILLIVLWDYRKMYLLVESEVRRAAGRAEEAEQRKNDLVVYLAHDLKTPLTSVLGYLELMAEEPELPLETRVRYTGVVRDKAERLEELINEFFEITRYNLTHIELEKSDINLTRMLEQVIFEFQPGMKEKGLSCELSAPADVMVSLDADRMQRVFDNLLRNALNYSFPNTEIRIQVWKDKGRLFLSFENEGNTIPEEKLNRIFEQFFRLDSARGTKNGGSGVGLAIAREIVELHGGTIRASSDENRIRFLIELPD